MGDQTSFSSSCNGSRKRSKSLPSLCEEPRPAVTLEDVRCRCFSASTDGDGSFSSDLSDGSPNSQYSSDEQLEVAASRSRSDSDPISEPEGQAHTVMMRNIP